MNRPSRTQQANKHCSQIVLHMERPHKLLCTDEDKADITEEDVHWCSTGDAEDAAVQDVHWCKAGDECFMRGGDTRMPFHFAGRMHMIRDSDVPNVEEPASCKFPLLVPRTVKTVPTLHHPCLLVRKWRAGQRGRAGCHGAPIL